MSERQVPELRERIEALLEEGKVEKTRALLAATACGPTITGTKEVVSINIHLGVSMVLVHLLEIVS